MITSTNITTQRVAVFGLGYVGSVTAACLAHRGFQVWGVDVNPDKVAMLQGGTSPIVEEKIGDIVREASASGHLRATVDSRQAIAETDACLVCVGTPSKDNGDLQLEYLVRVCQEIGDALADKSDYYTVVIRSTVLPGTTESVLKPILEQRSGKRAGVDFGLCFNPEFLREGSSVRDFLAPPFTLVGVTQPRDSQAVRDLYGWIETEFLVRDIKTAEMVKYVNNSYHAVKVAFANEVGRLCRVLDIDSHEVMDIFCKDTKQNLSAYYLKPGYSFGGSCLPKDLRAILYKAKSLDVSLELLQSTLASNRTQTQLGVQLAEQAGHRNIGLLGLSFKAGTDDLRESPLVELVETLYGRGYRIKIYDRHVLLSRLVGSNKAYIQHELPHIGELLCDDMQKVIQDSDTIIIGNSAPEFREALASIPDNKTVIDLVRIERNLDGVPEGYQGIGW
ncbi:MAG: nucleotide sugar dehydrogenase [Pirellulales bacterium]